MNKIMQARMAEKTDPNDEPVFSPLRDEDIDTESDDNLTLDPKRRTRRVRAQWLQRTFHPETRWKVLSLVLTVTLVLEMAIHFQTFRRCSMGSRPLDVSGYICAPNGAIPEVAVERGCAFDDLSFHWFPKEHAEDADNVALVQEFLDNGPWHRYLDQEGRYEIPADNLVLNSAYLTRREHIIHCKYAIRQTHLWVTKGWDMPFNYDHTLHCTQYLVDTIMENPPADLYNITTHVTPFPENKPIVHPYYPCDEEGITCVSW